MFLGWYLFKILSSLQLLSKMADICSLNDQNNYIMNCNKLDWVEQSTIKVNLLLKVQLKLIVNYLIVQTSAIKFLIVPTITVIDNLQWMIWQNNKFKKCKITNIIIDDTGMFNGQVITLSNFPFNFDTILFINLQNI